MKKNKIILTTAATLLSVCVIGTTVALYSNTASKSINISGSTTVNSAKYALGDIESAGIQYSYGNESNKTKATYTATSTMSLSDANKINYVGDTVLAKLSIALTVPSNYSDFLDISISINGYGEATANNYWVNKASEGFTVPTVTGTGGTRVLTYSSDIAFKNVDTGFQTVQLNISTKDSLTNAEFVENFAEKSFSFVISLDTPDTVAPFIVGDFNSWSLTTGYYEMYPDITSTPEGANTKDCWNYKIGNIETGKYFKGYNTSLEGDTKWIGDWNTNGNWSTTTALENKTMYCRYATKDNLNRYYIGV